MASSHSVLRTLLLTDLVNSTKLLEKLGDQRAFELFGRHDRLARDLLARYQGLEIDKTDGFLFLFERPIDALNYALEYHRALADLSKEIGITMEARAGIHLGEVFLRENSPEDVAKGAKPLEVEGLAKPMAARLMSLAAGKQTLLTRGAYDLAKRAAVDFKEPERSLKWMTHGLYAFKGVDDPVPIYEAGIEGESALKAPPDSAKVWQVARRGRKLAEIRKKRRRVAGVAGILFLLLITGLLLRHYKAPKELKDSRETVAVLGFANLSGLQTANWLSTALAETLTADLAGENKLRTLPGESVAQARNDLGIRRLQTLSEESLKALRQRLGADYFVSGAYLRTRGRPTLGLTISLQQAEGGEILASEKLRGSEDALFDLATKAGQMIRSRLGLEENLEGSAHLEASFPSSATGTRLYVQGLEALRSYQPQKGASLLEQAAIMDPEAPLVQEALAAAWSALGYDSRAVESAEKAWGIAENSEILPREQRLLIEARYAQTTGKWPQAVEAYQKLFGFDPLNLEYGLQLSASQISAGRATAALETLKALRRFPEPSRNDPRIDIQKARAAAALSNYDEQLKAARSAVNKASAIHAGEMEARATVLAGQALHRLGAKDEAAQEYAQARRLYEEAGNTARVAQTINLQAILRWQAGDFDGAAEFFRQSLQLCRALGDRGCQASAEGNLASLALQKGDLNAAEQAYNEALDLFREVGNRNYEAVALSNLGLLQSDQGRLTEARGNLEEALKILQQTGRRSSWAHTLYSLGDVQLVQGEVDEAIASHRAALKTREELEEPAGEAASRFSLSRALLEKGRLDEAFSQAEKARTAFKKLKKGGDEARAAALCGLIKVEDGHAEEAANFLGSAEGLESDGRSSSVEGVWIRALAQLKLGKVQQALESVSDICADSDSRPVCLEAALVRAEALKALGREEDATALRKTIAETARARGFGLILKKATR